MTCLLTQNHILARDVSVSILDENHGLLSSTRCSAWVPLRKHEPRGEFPLIVQRKMEKYPNVKTAVKRAQKKANKYTSTTPEEKETKPATFDGASSAANEGYDLKNCWTLASHQIPTLVTTYPALPRLAKQTKETALRRCNVM